MFAGAMMLLQLGGQYDGDFERNPYGEQYASRKWLDDHMLSFCKAGSESSGTTKQCIGAAGFPLAALQLAAPPVFSEEIATRLARPSRQAASSLSLLP